MMLLRGIALLLAVGGVAPPPQDEVVIRTTTSLVEVRVVVEDKDQNPIANLERSNFEILDNSQPRPIRLFAAYRGPNPPPLKSGADAEDASTSTSPTPSEYALIVLDWMNTDYEGRVRVQEELLKLLADFEPRQWLGIYVLSKVKSGMLSEFTHDRNLLSFLVRGMSLDPGEMTGRVRRGGLGGPGGPRRDGTFVSSPANDLAFFQASHQTVDTTLALEMIAEHMVKIPGRKTLIWISDGTPLVVGGSYFSAYSEPAIHKLNISDTAVYVMGPPQKGHDLSKDEFSRRTGGAYIHSNEVEKSMRKALEDTEISYTLGFHLPEGAKPGLHGIVVKVNVPHGKLRYRESYDPYPAFH